MERELRGRVVSLYITVFTGIFTIGGQAFGWFSDTTSAPWAPGLAGGACPLTPAASIPYPRPDSGETPLPDSMTSIGSCRQAPGPG